jgi:hypothetical protein
MPVWLFAHLRQNAIAYVALFAAVGGTSYAAVGLKPGSVRSATLATGAVTHAKLARNSVTSANVKPGSLRASDFTSSTVAGSAIGKTGQQQGEKGDPGPQGAPGPAGGATVAFRTRATGAVNAPHGANTSVPLTNTTWTQGAGELNLIAGAITVQTPSTCTGSFGNALVVSVDGTPTTIGLAPTAPASQKVTVPVVVGTLMDSPGTTSHRLTAALANSCTKDGEDYAVSDVKLNVIRVP